MQAHIFNRQNSTTEQIILFEMLFSLFVHQKQVI